MAKAQRYLGGRTSFGTITHITDRVYHAEATVQAKDGSTRTFCLPFLIAHGVALAVGEAERPKPSKTLARA